MKLIYTLLFLFILNSVSGQSIDSLIEYNSSEISNESSSDINDELPLELQQLAEHKINLNSDDIILLQQVNLISPIQLKAIINHKIKYGSFLSLEELQVINEIDSTTLSKIVPFIYVTAKPIGIESRNSLTIRFQQSVKNYIPADYQGDPTRITIKFRGNQFNKFSYGLLAEKDPGEKVIFGSGIKGFDFYSFFLEIKPEKYFRKIIIGDYSTSFGQGLVSWSGSGFSSSENIISLCKSGRGFSPSTSSDENRYLRGIALEFPINKFLIRTWFSFHKIDGIVVNDTSSNSSVIQSFQTSGYHRTQSELQAFHSIAETNIGTNILYVKNNWNLSLTTSILKYNSQVRKIERKYNQFEFSGNSNSVVGFDYQKTFRNILFFGEIAKSETQSLAYINGSLISLGKNISFTAVHHQYPINFHSIKSNAFGSNTLPANESGIYFGLQLKLSKSVTFSGYINQDQFPFMKYRVDFPSTGISKGLALNYQPNKTSSFQIRYKSKAREFNLTENYYGLKNLYLEQIDGVRFHCNLTISKNFDWRTKIEFNREKINSLISNSAYYVAQDLFYHSDSKSFSLNFRYAIYVCPDFNLRFYEYENDLPGSFSIPFYSGDGSRFYVNCTMKRKNIVFSLKFARSWIIYSTMKTENVISIDDIKMQINLNL